jgi:hypothetical protein
MQRRAQAGCHSKIYLGDRVEAANVEPATCIDLDLAGAANLRAEERTITWIDRTAVNRPIERSRSIGI